MKYIIPAGVTAYLRQVNQALPKVKIEEEKGGKKK